MRTIRLLAIIALIFLPAVSFSSERYDGNWLTKLSCPPKGNTEGYTWQFVSVIQNGNLHGERGTAGQPGYFTIDGAIGDDGNAKLAASGVIASREYARAFSPTRASLTVTTSKRNSKTRPEQERRAKASASSAAPAPSSSQSSHLLHQPGSSLEKLSPNNNRCSANGSLSKLELSQPRGLPHPMSSFPSPQNALNSLIPEEIKNLANSAYNFPQFSTLVSGSRNKKPKSVTKSHGDGVRTSAPV